MTAHFHSLVRALQSIYNLLQLEETEHQKNKSLSLYKNKM